MAAQVLHQLLPHAGKSLRIGISGVPGAGKSTFIESFGLQLIQNGHRVAVLAVDPSSSVTKGSILGDKTRMEKLSRDDHAFIRPSPSGGTLGGVASKTRETITVCEAAGFDVILVETVGVGQSEITVRSMVDFFLLLQISGAGDELQGIKKGVIEIADAIVINKADGDNIQKAEMTRNQFETAIHYLKPVTRGWNCRVLTCSALTGSGIPDIRRMIWDFKEKTTETGIFQQRRKEQAVNWFFSMIDERMRAWFYNYPGIREDINTLKEKIASGNLLPTTGAEQVMEGFLEKISPKKGE
jgi:LAO/AO transport system kinase